MDTADVSGCDSLLDSDIAIFYSRQPLSQMRRVLLQVPFQSSSRVVLLRIESVSNGGPWRWGLKSAGGTVPAEDYKDSSTLYSHSPPPVVDEFRSRCQSHFEEYSSTLLATDFLLFESIPFNRVNYFPASREIGSQICLGKRTHLLLDTKRATIHSSNFCFGSARITAPRPRESSRTTWNTKDLARSYCAGFERISRLKASEDNISTLTCHLKSL